MRGIECKEVGGGRARKRREEGRESSRTIGGGKEEREKRATSPGEQGGRGGLFIGHTSERERAGESQRLSLYIFHGTGFHDCVSAECEARKGERENGENGINSSFLPHSAKNRNAIVQGAL